MGKKNKQNFISSNSYEEMYRLMSLEDKIKYQQEKRKQRKKLFKAGLLISKMPVEKPIVTEKGVVLWGTTLDKKEKKKK